jgi:hypothetical protein
MFALAGTCGIPSTALAISVNVTIVGPSARGFLTLGPSDRMLPITSTINYKAGASRENNAIVGLSTDGAGGIFVFDESAGPVQFILDVNGYFR